MRPFPLRTLTLLTLVIATGCAGPVVPAAPRVPAAEPAWTPLERIVGYRLQAGEGGPRPVVVGGVAPSVSGLDRETGVLFRLRPATSDVMRVDAAGNVKTFGGWGFMPGRFKEPASLFVGFRRVYVADTGNHRIQVFDLSGRLQEVWGAMGNRVGAFIRPRSIEATWGGYLTIVDDVRVQYYTHTGSVVERVPLASPPILTFALSQAPGASPANRTPLAQEVDDIYALMARLRKLAQQMRDQARTQREAEVQSQVSALQNAAQAIRDATQTRFAGAVVAGMTTTIVTEAAGLGVGRPGTTGALGPRAAGGATVTMGDLTPGLSRLADTGVGLTQRLPGDAFDAAAASRHLARTADDADARKAAAETAANVHGEGVAQANDLTRQMLDVIRDIRDKLAAINQAQVETSRGIARNI
jgi:hypothetical protein